MCVRDASERGEEGGVNDVLVKDVEEEKKAQNGRGGKGRDYG